jgi:hypothetical protein
MTTKHASGTFEVTLNPLQTYSDEKRLGHMSIDKQFFGELAATSTGEMLSAMTDVKGSAGYVAIERVVGKLHERYGTFVLQHFATMNRNVPHLVIEVVPDSGTGELFGLSGKMKIVVADGKHTYEFEYALHD